MQTIILDAKYNLSPVLIAEGNLPSPFLDIMLSNVDLRNFHSAKLHYEIKLRSCLRKITNPLNKSTLVWWCKACCLSWTDVLTFIANARWFSQLNPFLKMLACYMDPSKKLQFMPCISKLGTSNLNCMAAATNTKLQVFWNVSWELYDVLGWMNRPLKGIMSQI